MSCLRTDYSGPGGSSSRWLTPAALGKIVEVRHAPVDELFKDLRGSMRQNLVRQSSASPIASLTVFCLFSF